MCVESRADRSEFDEDFVKYVTLSFARFRRRFTTAALHPLVDELLNFARFGD
ncbi:hypothetical protein BN903_126 [Halorubrum sp. AJ67]|nr:hypothetical protein BN903_126 [Halorubrum sp. AJ67]